MTALKTVFMTMTLMAAAGTASALSVDLGSGLGRGKAIEMAAARFDRADVNGDGILSREEMQSQHAARKKSPTADDRNAQDAVKGERVEGIRRGRAIAKAVARFDRADTNADGILSRDEMKAQRSARKEKINERRHGVDADHHDKSDTLKDSDQEPRLGGMRKPGYERPMLVEEIFMIADTDNSGEISIEELSRVLRKFKEFKLQGGTHAE